MADRMQFQAPSIFTNTSPTVQVDDGTADFLKTQANVFLNNANEAHKRQLRSDLELAQTEGTRLGYNLAEKFRPMERGSLFAKEFNQTGLYTAGQQISLKTQRKVRELASQYPANPGGLQTAMQGWKEGFAGELPDELVPVFGMNYDTIADAAIESAKAQRKALDAQQAAADFYVYDREVTNTMEKIAPKMFQSGAEGEAARAAVATLRQNYMESLAGNGPEGEYEVGGYKVKSAPGRSGAYSPLEIAKKMQAFDNGIIANGVYGNFQKEAENGNAVDAYMQFSKGDMEVTAIGKDGTMQSMKVSDILTNDEIEEISGKMRTYIGGQNSIEDGEYRRWERGKDMYNDQVLQDAYKASYEVIDEGNGNKRVIGGNPVALQNIISDALENPLVDAATIDKLQTLAKDLGTGQIDNPITVGQTWTGIAKGEIADYTAIPSVGVSDQTRIEMYKAVDERNKGQGWMNSTRYRIANDYADAVLAPEKSAGFSLLGDPDSQSAADRAEWNRLMIEDILAAEKAGALPANMNALPSKNQMGPEYDVVARGKQIADEIAARRNKPANPEVVEIDTQIKDVQAQINNPKKGDDTEAIKQRYRELQERKAQLQSRQQMGQQ